MMQSLSLRERRLIALAILLALIAGAYLVIVAPILGGFATRREARAAAQTSLVRDAGLIASLPRIRADATRVRATLPRYAILAASPATAAEAARERLTALVSSAGGVLEAVRQQSASPSALRYELNLRADLPKLVVLLRRLESEAPLAAIEGLAISTDPGAQGAPPLRVRLDIVYACAIYS